MANSATPGTSTALTFNFATQALRVITIDGEPWFCASDVCDVLGYVNGRDALAKHCRAPGVAKRDIGVITGKKADGTDAVQQVNVVYINEGNLYRLCIKSHKPEAQKFEAWVCDEVLPSIRKTGRYEALNTAQATTASTDALKERLSPPDLLNLKRMIGFCTDHFAFKDVWVQGIWFYLRRALGVPSPQAFSVEHLPQLASELARMQGISYQVHTLLQDIERQAASRILRKGEPADLVLADLKAMASTRMLATQDHVARLPSYLRSAATSITQRSPHGGGAQYGAEEQTGYFEQTKGVQP